MNLCSAPALELKATQPFILQFSPVLGAPGTGVTISGQNFVDVTGVTFGNGSASFVVMSPRSIFATVPLDGTTGPITVATRTASANSRLSFTVAPCVTDFQPTEGSPGTVVVINGANFTDARSVRFNGLDAVNPSVVSATQIRATVPPRATSGPITVTTSAGAASSFESFRIIGTEPVISDFSPTIGAPGTLVTIEGKNLLGATAVKFNGTNSISFSVTAATQISATVPAGAGTGPISVTTASGTGTSVKSFTITTAPVISDFSPTNGLPGTAVTIEGFNFTGATAVRFNGTNATQFSIPSPNQLRATVPIGATTGPISITTANGTGTSSRLFTVTSAPTISDFAPTNGPPGTTIAIYGANFLGTTNVSIGTNSALFSIVAPTQITAIVPTNARTGVITIRSPNGVGVSGDQFTVTSAKPVINSFSPTTGRTGTSIVIEGINFSGATAVQLNGSNVTFSVTAPTQILCTVGDSATSGAFSVTTPGGTAVSSLRFIVAPRLTSFSPTVGVAGSRVIVRGANFTDANAVRFNGTPASFVVDSPNQLTATVPTNAVAGTLSVASVAGIISSTEVFTILPNITSFSPSTGSAGTQVTILGTHLSDASAVQFNGVASGFTRISSGEIQAIVPAGANTGPITVTTPLGIAKSASDFLVSVNADLAVTQFHSPDPAIRGARADYTVTVTNRGPATATNVILTDTISTNATLLSASVSQGTFSWTEGGGIVCQLGTLTNGAVAKLSFAITADGFETITNIVNVTAVSPDPDSANNTSVGTTSIIVAGVPLVIQRSLDNRATISWSVSATNLVLQTRELLGGSAEWMSVTNAVVMSGGLKSVTITLDGRNRFYRLAKP